MEKSQVFGIQGSHPFSSQYEDFQRKSSSQTAQSQSPKITALPQQNRRISDQSNQQLSTQYTQSYADYGRMLDDGNVDNSFLELIIQNLPQNFIGADIGSCDGLFGNQIMKRKKGKIISVDPYPIAESVVHSSGQDFLKLYNQVFDCVIFKYSIHFFEDFSTFYENLSRSLKPNGKVFVLTTSPDTKFPWTEQIHKSFAASCKNYENKFLNHEVKETIVQTTRKMRTKDFKEFLLCRGFSNLLQNTEEQIQKAVQNLPKEEQVEIIRKYKIMEVRSKVEN